MSEQQAITHEPRLLRLIVTPYAPGRFSARLDGQEVVRSRKPYVDGARKLLELGLAHPDDLLTVRHEGAPHGSFVPKPIGSLALIDYTETASGIVRCRPPDKNRFVLLRLRSRTAEDGSAGMGVA